MPVISRFYGIVIKMYFRMKEHEPPHIHAIYGDTMGVFRISDGEMIDGDLPPKGKMMVSDFVQYYSRDLLHMWETQEFKILTPVEDYD